MARTKGAIGKKTLVKQIAQEIISKKSTDFAKKFAMQSKLAEASLPKVRKVKKTRATKDFFKRTIKLPKGMKVSSVSFTGGVVTVTYK